MSNPLENRDKKFRYQLLSRLQMDCEYYLGHGNRCTKHLWSENETSHIADMKTLWNSFDNDEKPEWLSWADILDYEKKIITS